MNRNAKKYRIPICLNLFITIILSMQFAILDGHHFPPSVMDMNSGKSAPADMEGNNTDSSDISINGIEALGESFAPSIVSPFASIWIQSAVPDLESSQYSPEIYRPPMS